MMKVLEESRRFPTILRLVSLENGFSGSSTLFNRGNRGAPEGTNLRGIYATRVTYDSVHPLSKYLPFLLLGEGVWCEEL